MPNSPTWEIDPEFSIDYEGDPMQKSHEELREVEGLYGPVSLAGNEVYCGDDRPAIGLEALYIKLYGALANVPYNIEVLREAYEPGSVTEPFAQTAASTLPIMRETSGVKGGVHSDDHTENGSEIDTNKEKGDLGCAYLQKRAAISGLIASNAGEVIVRARELRPELFISDRDQEAAENITAAHARLIEREGFISPGRETALAMMKKGAKGIVVSGPHTAKVAIINLRKGTTLDTVKADESGVPSYAPDLWAASGIFEGMRHLYPYDSRVFEIAELIDTVGTIMALGVEEVEVRR